MHLVIVVMQLYIAKQVLNPRTGIRNGTLAGMKTSALWFGGTMVTFLKIILPLPNPFQALMVRRFTHMATLSLSRMPLPKLVFMMQWDGRFAVTLHVVFIQKSV